MAYCRAPWDKFKIKSNIQRWYVDQAFAVIFFRLPIVCMLWIVCSALYRIYFAVRMAVNRYAVNLSLYPLFVKSDIYGIYGAYIPQSR